MTEKQTVAGAYAKIASHEDLCAERYRGIHEAIADLKGLIRWILGGVASVAVALIAWMAVQLYDANNARIEAVSAQLQER